jgi:hypothetical protein
MPARAPGVRFEVVTGLFADVVSAALHAAL